MVMPGDKTPLTITLERRQPSAAPTVGTQGRPVRLRSSAAARRPAPARAVAQQFVRRPQRGLPIVALELPAACRQRLDAWAFDPACSPPTPLVQSDMTGKLTH